MKQYQTKKDCGNHRKSAIVCSSAIIGVLLSMLAGLFWVTLDTRTISAETKGAVDQIRWIVESQIIKTNAVALDDTERIMP